MSAPSHNTGVPCHKNGYKRSVHGLCTLYLSVFTDGWIRGFVFLHVCVFCDRLPEHGLLFYKSCFFEINFQSSTKNDKPAILMKTIIAASTITPADRLHHRLLHKADKYYFPQDFQPWNFTTIFQGNNSYVPIFHLAHIFTGQKLDVQLS